MNNIHQRLNEVRKAVAYLRKEKEVIGAGTYKVVTHDQVTAAVREHFIQQGILVVPRLLKSRVADTGTVTKNSVPIIRYEAWYEVDFVNCDEPGDKLTIPIESHALDQGDKAPGKAISYATKYTMLKLLSIETGEDEEGRPEAKGVKQVSNAPLLDRPITPTSGALAELSLDQQKEAQSLASRIVELWDMEKPVAAYEAYYESGKDADFLLGVWECLKPFSSMRNQLKKMHRESQVSTQA